MTCVGTIQRGPEYYGDKPITDAEPNHTLISETATHTGRVRDHNEDCYFEDAENGLWIVADGMGGHAAGEVASRIATEAIRQALAEGSELPEAVESAHGEVVAAISENPEQAGMGTTVVAARTHGSHFVIAWVGDSRAYRLNQSRFEQLTRDHNLYERLILQGQVEPEEAAKHPDAETLVQAIGVSKEPQPTAEWITGDLEAGESLLLCTDGLTDEVSDAGIEQILRSGTTPKEIIQALVKAALDAGGRDNITLALIHHPADNTNRTTSLGSDKSASKLWIFAGLATMALAGLLGWIILR